MPSVGIIVCYGLIGAAGVGFLWLIAEAHNWTDDFDRAWDETPDEAEDEAHGDVVELHPEVKGPATRETGRWGAASKQAAGVTGQNRTHGVSS